MKDLTLRAVIVVRWNRKTEKPTIAVSFEACPGDRQTKECVTGLTEEQREKSLYAVRHDVTRATHTVSATPLAAWPHSIYGDVAAVDVGRGCVFKCGITQNVSKRVLRVMWYMYKLIC